MKIDHLLLIGKRTKDLVPYGQRNLIHRKVESSLSALTEKGLKEGFDLKVVSGHRSFERQKTLWNAKALGQKDIVDDKGCPIDISLLSPREMVFSILRWSAFPGASRHHWGSDIDVIDGNAVPLGYSVQLSPQEVSPWGPFGPFHQWLDEIIAAGESFGFYRPYDEDYGGIAPEKWHLSYAPLSIEFAKTYNVDFFENFLKNHGEQDIYLIDVVKSLSKDIFTQFISRTSPPPF